MKKINKKILISGLLVLTSGILVTTVANTLNSVSNQNKKNTKKNFSSIDSTNFKWPAMGRTIKTEINGVMSTIYTPSVSDYFFENINNARTLRGFRTKFVNRIKNELNYYINLQIPPYTAAISDGAFTSNSQVLPNNHKQNSANYINVNNRILRVDFSISRNLTSFGAYSFDGLDNLELVNFDKNLTYHVSSIGYAVFRGCRSLRKVFNFDRFDSAHIPNDMFKYDVKLEDVSFSPNLKTIGVFAFSGTNIQNADFSKTKLERIQEGVFYNSNIKSAYIPDGVTIDGRVFSKEWEKLSSDKINMQAENYNYDTLSYIGLDPTVPTKKKELKLYLNTIKLKKDFKKGNSMDINAFNSLSMSEKGKYFILDGPEQNTLAPEVFLRDAVMKKGSNYPDIKPATRWNVNYINKLPPYWKPEPIPTPPGENVNISVETAKFQAEFGNLKSAAKVISRFNGLTLAQKAQFLIIKDNNDTVQPIQDVLSNVYLQEDSSSKYEIKFVFTNKKEFEVTDNTQSSLKPIPKPTPPPPPPVKPEENPNTEVVENKNLIITGSTVGSILFVVILIATVILVLQRKKEQNPKN